MQLVEEWSRYALAGTVYALGLGGRCRPPGTARRAVRRTPLFALLGFGAVGGTIVAVGSAGRRGLRRLVARTGDGEHVEAVSAAVSTGAADAPGRASGAAGTATDAASAAAGKAAGAASEAIGRASETADAAAGAAAGAASDATDAAAGTRETTRSWLARAWDRLPGDSPRK